jgi:hypothetical protein
MRAAVLPDMRLTYANVVATLALFIALGGSSYAAITITGRNVRNGSLTTSDIRNHSLLSRDFKTGQLPAGKTGPQGPQGAQGAPGARGLQGRPGSDATKLFAYVQEGLNPPGSDAEVEYGSGVTGVSDPSGDSSYVVSFGRSLTRCVVEAVPGFGNPSGNSSRVDDATPSLSLMANPSNEVLVDFEHGNPAKSVDTSFMVTAFC